MTLKKKCTNQLLFLNQKNPNGSDKPKGKPILRVKVHGIPVRKQRKWDLKCPMCKQVYHLVKEVNDHIKDKHPKFRYKCRYCIKKYQNYASRYKHEKKHREPNHVFQDCQKAFFFKKDLMVHSCVHTGQG